MYYPEDRFNSRDTYHLFVIQLKNRDRLKKFLFKNKIESNIHYPIPIHKQKMFIKKKQLLPKTEKQSNEILSLPINQYLNTSDIEKVCAFIRKFLQN